MIELLADPAVWVSFATLCILEIVLGIDNIIFVSIVSDRLPVEQQRRARMIGLSLAMLMRIGLLFSLVWMIGLSKPVLTVFDLALSWRDIILFSGGLFLIGKATIEIYHTVEGVELPEGTARKVPGFAAAIGQIVVLDAVFSIDSILTAVGLSDHLPVMIAAVIVAIIIMMLAADSVAGFIRRHDSIKLLTLAFLVLIGAVLVADGLQFHIPKGYIYFSLAFSLSVQALAIWAAQRR